ncbi:MAG: aminodeoxychorismate synthase component I [Sarcina sp.]
MNFKIQEFETNLSIDKIYNLWKDEQNTILLDSSKKDSKYSKYSFIGINPFLEFLSKDGKCYINNEEVKGKTFEVLKEFLEKYKFENENKLPFISGAIGFISYDEVFSLENINSRHEDILNIPDSCFIFFDNIIIFDLEKNKKYITALNILEENRKSIEKIRTKIERIEESCKSEKKYSYNEDFLKFNSKFDINSYKEAVDETKKYIEDGHTYIMNMTHRFETKSDENSFDIYEKLRKINPAPFSAYLNMKDYQIISSSPERFLNIVDKKVETRPIKGTMPRGLTKEADGKNKEILLSSEKDKSELLMVVDLERNDLSKICKPFSVKVTELFKLEEYPTVFHLVSTIEGELEENYSSVECVKECFPGGSITGTPKFRTMEIIDELEQDRRGIYTGCIGYFDFRGNCDFNIIIRTILKKDNDVIFGVGGGITIESNPESEYYETLDKAKALMRVL